MIKKFFRRGYLRVIFALYAVFMAASLSGSQNRSLVAEGIKALDPSAEKTPLPLTAAIDPALEVKIEEIIQARPHDRAEWGIEVMSLDTGNLLYSHNGTRPLIPASNMKLFTTAAAMHYLGARYRFSTAVYGTGQVAAGALQGDLVLKGGADPFFSKTFLADSAQSHFNDIAQQLYQRGIRRVDGNIVGDGALSQYGSAVMASRFMEAREALGSGGSDDDLEDEVGTGVPAFGDNLIGIRVSPEKAGKPVRVSVEPQTGYFTIVNRATATSSRRTTLKVSRMPGSTTITVSGRLSVRQRNFYTYVKIDDPAAFAAHLLKESMERSGIEVRGEAQSRKTGSGLAPEMLELAKHDSSPLLGAITVINKQSINPYAELLLRMIGSEARGRGTPEAGISAVQEFASRVGIEAADLAMYDGSGLSRSNLSSPRAEILLLRYIASQDHFADFLSTLAVSGTDGTLRNRLGGQATFQRVLAKTGTLGNVIALGGFMYTQSGERLAFTIFCNNFAGGATATRLAVDQIVETLARHSYEKPTNNPAKPL